MQEITKNRDLNPNVASMSYLDRSSVEQLVQHFRENSHFSEHFRGDPSASGKLRELQASGQFRELGKHLGSPEKFRKDKIV